MQVNNTDYFIQGSLNLLHEHVYSSQYHYHSFCPENVSALFFTSPYLQKMTSLSVWDGLFINNSHQEIISGHLKAWQLQVRFLSPTFIGECSYFSPCFLYILTTRVSEECMYHLLKLTQKVLTDMKTNNGKRFQQVSMLMQRRQKALCSLSSRTAEFV